MGHIFISYSHKDTDYAHGLANNLQSIGFEIWMMSAWIMVHNGRKRFKNN
jgi:hypothetical protein